MKNSGTWILCIIGVSLLVAIIVHGWAYIHFAPIPLGDIDVQGQEVARKKSTILAFASFMISMNVGGIVLLTLDGRRSE